MKIDNAELRGHARIKYTPAHPEDAVPLSMVQNLVSQGTAGAVFITDVAPTSSGIVGGRQYVANTVPANAVLTSCFADTHNLRISFLAEGPASFYSPGIDANGTAAQLIEEVPGDKRMFRGYVDINLATSGSVTVTSSTGATATINVTLLTEGPVVQSVTIGALPTGQTAVKAGDVVPFTAIVANDTTAVSVKNLGAASAVSGSIVIGAENSASAGFRTVTGSFTVSNRTGAQKLSIAAANFIGTEGTVVASGNTAPLDQTYPVISAFTITYPNSQTALKGTESATVAATITNADVYNYVFDNGSVDAATTYAQTKTVTRANGGYVTGNNYHVTAKRSSNGAVTTADAAVLISDTAAQAAITIVGSPARLQSSANGNDYTVQIAPDQVLAGPPSLDASSGTWQGSWTLSGNNWRRTLRIKDTDPKGAQTFSNLVLTNRAAKTSSTITSGAGYNVGGLVLRTITFPAFARFAPIGGNVVTIGKTRARYTGTADYLALRNDTNQAAASYTISNDSGNYSATGNQLFLSDLDYANSNTSGTLQVDFEETV